MVDRNIINKLGLSAEELDKQISGMFTDIESEYLEKALQKKVDSYLPGNILKGMIVSQIGNDVIVEIGLKSEGVVNAVEFDSPDEIESGREIEVLLEETDSADGVIHLSKRKADRIRGWERIIETSKEGDIVKGEVVRRIKGGLLVDIGVPVFLPASQVDIRKPGDISRFIGKEIECVVLKIDIEGRNIVISRRKLIEEERKSSKEDILAEIEVGQIRKGVVKNIADFGIFVDLGGLDGLLHISDLSWGRISHPSEVVKLDEEIECIVIGVDKRNEKISLGLKQKTSSPWENVEENYPVGARVKGKVVNVMNYGVFIRLEDGIEGLVHISEMSWIKRLNHPSEMLNLGDEAEVIVLSVNKDRQEISLGLKQTESNPWAVASQKYPVGTIVTATVHSITNFGAFVEIEPGIDGMIHISDLSWTKKYSHPAEALEKGKRIKCVVLDVNEKKQRISLGIKQLSEDPWARAILEKYIPGHIVKGKITKITNFGAFVELEPDLEGLLHISELADHKVDKPQDVVKEGEEVEVKILKVEKDLRKIGLSLRRALWAAEEEEQKATTEADKKSPEEVAQTIPPDSDAEQPSTSEVEKESAEAVGDAEVVEKEVKAGEIEKSQEIEPSEEVAQTIPPDSDAEQPSTSEGEKESAEAAGDAEVVEKEVEAGEIEKSQEIEPSEEVDAEPAESKEQQQAEAKEDADNTANQEDKLADGK